MTEDANYWDLCKKQADNAFYSFLKVKKEDFTKTHDAYMLDTVKRAEYETQY